MYCRLSDINLGALLTLSPSSYWTPIYLVGLFKGVNKTRKIHFYVRILVEFEVSLTVYCGPQCPLCFRTKEMFYYSNIVMLFCKRIVQESVQRAYKNTKTLQNNYSHILTMEDFC